MKFIYPCETPIGKLKIAEVDGQISHILFDGAENLPGYEERKTELIEKAEFQLKEYFRGRLRVFDLPLLLQGTEFQKGVWRALMEIPYGETRSYKDVAAIVKAPKAVRAVGMSNNRNRLPIIIPCHRVIGSNGKLVGYAGGLDVKQWLLDMEKAEN